MSTPAELWLQHRTDIAELDDEPVYAAINLDIEAASTLVVRRMAANQSRPQGLVLDADAAMRVGSIEAPTMVLWSDTSPAEVAVAVPAGRLTVSHAWRDGDVVHAWTAWSGIVRHEQAAEPGSLRLIASDGHGGFSADLDIVLELERPIEAGGH